MNLIDRRASTIVFADLGMSITDLVLGIAELGLGISITDLV